LEGRWEEGREAFARFDALPDNHLKSFRAFARRAAFEFKAGQDAQAEEYIRQAKGMLTEPTALWISLAIEAARYKLSKPLQLQFNKQFKAAVAKKVSSGTAGALSELMAAYVAGKIEYPGRAGHVRDIVSYLRRTTRMKYAEPDLVHACVFLQHLDDQQPLLDKLANRGLKLFPKSPYFLHATTVLELSKGPFACDPKRCQKQLEKALSLAQASQNSRDIELIPTIKSSLSRVQDIREAMENVPFGRGGFAGGMPFGIPDLFASLMGQFGEEDELGPDE
jgi:hypothetical protein